MMVHAKRVFFSATGSARGNLLKIMAPTPHEINKAIGFWKKCALDNLKSAEVMLRSKRYNFTMFLCHQTLESALKALFVSLKKDRPPFVHKLPRLLNETGLSAPPKVDGAILKADAHYIKARYLEDRFNIRVYNRKSATILLEETKEALKWLLNQIG